MGVETVAVYSDADAKAPHVREADFAVRLGPAARPRELPRPSQGAGRRGKETGADSIHPGYGFLSENAEFAGSRGGGRADLGRTARRRHPTPWD